MFEKGAKQRSNIGSDKLKWDGEPSTCDPFSKDLKGEITKLGMGCLLCEDVQKMCLEVGPSMANDFSFFTKHEIDRKQLAHDVKHLHGVLQSSTKDFDCVHVLAHAKCQDGFTAFLEMEAENQCDVSKILKEEELEDLIKQTHLEKEWATLVACVSRFTTWVHQLEALGSSSVSDSQKKKQLLRNLQTDPDLSGLIQK